MSTKIPTAMEIRRGISRFMVSYLSLRGEELCQPGMAHGQQHRANHDRDDEEDLHRVRGLEASEKPRILRQVRARRVVLLTDEGVIACDDKEGELVNVCGAGDLNRADLMSRFGQEERLGTERAQE